MNDHERITREIMGEMGLKETDRVTATRATELRAMVWARVRQQPAPSVRARAVGAVTGLLIAAARQARPSESALLGALRAHPLGATMRLGIVVGPYTVDAGWFGVRLAVLWRARDYKAGPGEIACEQQRDRYLARIGWTLLRFSDGMLRQPEACVAKIVRAHGILGGTR